eukprot:11165032-Lingulodinium_polyedra.AAC.1
MVTRAMPSRPPWPVIDEPCAPWPGCHGQATDGHVTNGRVSDGRLSNGCSSMGESSMPVPTQ